MTRILRFCAVLALVLTHAGCGGSRSGNPPVSPATDAPSAVPAAVDDRPVILAFGDSLTAGLGVDPEGNFPSQLQKKVDGAGYRYRVVNAGVSGDTSAEGLNRLSAILSLRPAVTIVELGANDGLRGMPVEQTRENLYEIIEAAKNAGSKVILAGMEMPPNYGPEYTRRFRDLYPQLSRRCDVPLIPFFLSGVGGIAELNQEDGIHPTAQGYAKVTENVWKTLQPVLKAGGTK